MANTQRLSNKLPSFRSWFFKEPRSHLDRVMQRQKSRTIGHKAHPSIMANRRNLHARREMKDLSLLGAKWQRLPGRRRPRLRYDFVF